MILAAGGSAAGIDNRPYVIYYCGATFTAYLLGQATLTTNIPHSSTVDTLGPNIDLGN